MRKITALLLIVISTIALLAGCATNQSVKTIDTPQSGVVKEDTPKESATPPTDSSTPDTLDDDMKYVLSDNLLSIGQTVEYEGIAYTVNSIAFSKEIGNRDPDKINFFDESRDEKGNLTGSESFAYVSETIENVSDSDLEVLVNSNTFVLIDNNNMVTETGAEYCYIDKPQQTDPMKYHHFILKPGETTSFELTYIIKDEQISEQLYYMIGNGGADIDSSTNRFIQANGDSNQ